MLDKYGGKDIMHIICTYAHYAAAMRSERQNAMYYQSTTNPNPTPLSCCDANAFSSASESLTKTCARWGHTLLIAILKELHAEHGALEMMDMMYISRCMAFSDQGCDSNWQLSE